MLFASAGRRSGSIPASRQGWDKLGAIAATFLYLFALDTTASATQLTLFADGVAAVDAELPFQNNDTFEVVVGIDDVFELLLYDIDILYDESVISIESASQLACLYDGSSCAPFAFTIDPTNPNSAEQGRRSAALTLPPNLLIIDPAVTGEPNPALFSITFRVIGQLALGELSTIQFGILNQQANDITDASGTSLIPALTDSDAEIVSLSVIPEPTGSLMSLVALATLAALHLRREASVHLSRVCRV